MRAPVACPDRACSAQIEMSQDKEAMKEATTIRGIIYQFDFLSCSSKLADTRARGSADPAIHNYSNSISAFQLRDCAQICM